MTINTSALFLDTRNALDRVGLSITNGATSDSIQHARATVRHAKRMLALIEIEAAQRRKEETRRQRARDAAWTPEALPA